jgi:hypothetical protein
VTDLGEGPLLFSMILLPPSGGEETVFTPLPARVCLDKVAWFQ